MITTLSLSQLSNFLAAVWNSECYKSWGGESEAFWKAVAAKEFSRTFQDGWDYCESELQFSPRSGRHWWYKTTSGTVIVASQGCWTDESGSLPDIKISVEIPERRENGHHAGLLKSAIAGMDFYEWGSLFYAQEGTPQYVEARRQGMAIASDPEVIEAKAARRVSALSEVEADESEGEEYEDYGGSEEYEKVLT